MAFYGEAGSVRPPSAVKPTADRATETLPGCSRKDRKHFFADKSDKWSADFHSLRALDILAQYRGLMLHYPQPVFDDVADRHDADQLIPLDYRNVSELACSHPL